MNAKVAESAKGKKALNDRFDDLTETPWPELSVEVNRVTPVAIGCAIEVHRQLGPGLPEKLYEAALVYELRGAGLEVSQQHSVRVRYQDLVLPELVIDVLVEEVLVPELKAIEKAPDAHLAMLVSYLKAAEKPVGLLINFHAPTLKQGIYRRVNSDAARSVQAKQKSTNREEAMS